MERHDPCADGQQGRRGGRQRVEVGIPGCGVRRRATADEDDRPGGEDHHEDLPDHCSGVGAGQLVATCLEWPERPERHGGAHECHQPCGGHAESAGRQEAGGCRSVAGQPQREPSADHGCRDDEDQRPEGFDDDGQGPVRAPAASQDGRGTQPGGAEHREHGDRHECGDPEAERSRGCQLNGQAPTLLEIAEQLVESSSELTLGRVEASEFADQLIGVGCIDA